VTKHTFPSLLVVPPAPSIPPISPVRVWDADGIVHLLCVTAAKTLQQYPGREAEDLPQSMRTELCQKLIPKHISNEGEIRECLRLAREFRLTTPAARAHLLRCTHRLQHAQIHGVADGITRTQLNQELQEATMLAAWITQQTERHAHIWREGSRMQARRLDLALIACQQKTKQRPAPLHTLPSAQPVPASTRVALPPPPLPPSGVTAAARRSRTVH
jgi:hypothetical protein